MRKLLPILLALLFACGPAPEEPAVALRHMFLKLGQSNNGKVGNGPAGSETRIKSWYAVGAALSTDPPVFSSSGAFADTPGSFGDNAPFATRLADAGLTAGIINVTYGSTFISEWRVGSDEWDNFIIPQLNLALASAATTYAGDTLIWHLYFNLGEEDTRFNNLPYQLSWASRFENDVYAGVKARVDAQFGAQSIDRCLKQTLTAITGGVFVPTVPNQQLVAAGSPNRLLTLDDLSLYDATTVHFSDAGYTVLGNAGADMWLRTIRPVAGIPAAKTQTHSARVKPRR